MSLDMKYLVERAVCRGMSREDIVEAINYVESVYLKETKISQVTSRLKTASMLPNGKAKDLTPLKGFLSNPGVLTDDSGKVLGYEQAKDLFKSQGYDLENPFYKALADAVKSGTSSTDSQRISDVKPMARPADSLAWKRKDKDLI